MNRGKGKSAAPAENPQSKVFTLKLGNLQASYPKLMADIEAQIDTMLTDEIKRQPKLEKMPLRVKDTALYTPAQGTFLVRIEPEHGGKVVTLLIRWVDLYIVAFYVEGVWYHYSEFGTEILPPSQDQFPYNPRPGVGTVKLPLTSSYLQMQIGGFDINVGKPAFTRCVASLGKLGELYKSEKGLKVLKSGPLSFRTVTISEAIRFALWRAWVTTNIDEELDSPVPKEHGQLFNYWADISRSVAQGKPWNGIAATDLMKKLRVVKRGDYIKPEKVQWAPSASGSGKN